MSVAVAVAVRIEGEDVNQFLLNEQRIFTLRMYHTASNGENCVTVRVLVQI